jgi:hypothetical protein
MEHVAATFHFAGEEWDIALPVCPSCLAATPGADVGYAA